MSSQSPTPAGGKNPLPVLGGAALAAGGYFAAKAATGALGYGSDVHPLRVLALCAPLLVGGVIALWPGRRFVTRAVVLVAAVGTSAAAWVYAPCRPDGLSLAAAAAERDALKARLTPPRYDEVAAAREIRDRENALGKDYPSLADALKPAVAAWGDAAARAVAERFAGIAPEDYPSGQAAEESARQLKNLFPATDAAVTAAVRGWVDRATRLRSEELAAVPPGDWAGFDRTAAKRKAHAAAFGAALLGAAEDEWASRTAAGAIDAAAKSAPKQRRKACREADARLLALRALGDSPGRFQPARQKLFAAAHEAARAEANRYVADRNFEAAYTVAVDHDIEWAQTTPHLPDAPRAVAELREACRYLSRLSEKAGDLPDVAPEPRGK